MNKHWGTLAIVAVIVVLASIFLNRVINPLLRKHSRQKFLKDFSEGKIKPRYFDTTIHFDEFGFGVKDDKPPEQPTRMSWSEVIKVTAYKRDMFSTDLICVFLSRADQTGIEIHEEINNWIDFITSLPKRLPDCKPIESWLKQITVPAFATNITELFLRRDNLATQENGK